MRVPLFLFLFLLSFSSFAGTTICDFAGQSHFGPKSISWNTVTKHALIQYGGTTYHGEVGFYHKYEGPLGGFRVNLIFDIKLIDKKYRSEFLVFANTTVENPIIGRAIGVSYIKVDGERHLNSSFGNSEVHCQRLHK